MNYKHLTTHRDENIRIITIDRETKMNALNLELISELGKVFSLIYEEKDLRGAILTGKGTKAFVAGADIADFTGFDEEEGRAMSEDGHAVFNKIENCPVPVIAAVNGFALGGGCELAMACHIRIASTNAKFGQPEVKLGIIPGYGGTQRLPRLVGKGIAMEMLMTGEMISAAKAGELGLVNHVVEPEELMDKANKIIQKIASVSPLAVAGVIESVNAGYHANRKGYQREIDLFSESFETEDFRVGTSAFLEKRNADFKGK